MTTQESSMKLPKSLLTHLVISIYQPKTRRKEAYLKASLFTASIAVAGIGLALLEVFKSQ